MSAPKIIDQWDLLTEQARLNNNDAGIDKMLDLLESHKELMNWQNAEVLLDYIDLIEKPENLGYMKRTFALVSNFQADLNYRTLLRLAVLETMIEELENPTHHDTPGK